ncbi:hypothetical protein An12g08850 [Aspergillus niger]|uniref:Uncharacterized protein n=2 Tax=Aspergillus niger TaxID=5061 RepID=A2R0J7_ASPNC|nr:hypothetical protein An12g08850 [Aspergillus niger]CAK41335.1 hypothetical protein An12g08850 [Aspergillus niger]
MEDNNRRHEGMAVGVCSTHSTGSYWKTQATVAAKRGLHDDGLRCPSSAELHARNNCNGLIKLLTKEYTVGVQLRTQPHGRAYPSWESGYERRQTGPRNVDILTTLNITSCP